MNFTIFMEIQKSEKRFALSYELSGQECLSYCGRGGLWSGDGQDDEACLTEKRSCFVLKVSQSVGL